MLIESIPREPLSFHLVPYDNPRLQNTLQAKTLEQKRKWYGISLFISIVMWTQIQYIGFTGSSPLLRVVLGIIIYS